jgi:hypothetical protein
MSVVSGNAPESIAELQVLEYSLVITLPKAGVGRLLVSYTRLRIPITPRPVTWNLAFSEHPKALIYGGSSDASAPPALLLRRSLSDVWPVWRRSRRSDSEFREYALRTIAE